MAASLQTVVPYLLITSSYREAYTLSDMAKNLMLWLVIAVVVMSVFQSLGPGESNGRAVEYTTFVEEVGQGQIQEAQFKNGEIAFRRRGGGRR